PVTGDVSADLIVTGETDCPSPANTRLVMAGYNPSAQATGFPAPMTFVCKDNSGEVEFRNGQEIARLDQVEIVAGPYSDHFVFANGTQVLTLNKTLAPGAIEKIPVTFRPTSVIPNGSVATIRYIWTDLIGNVTDTIEQILSGGSQVLTNTLSVEKEDKTIYTADPMERFTVDVKMLLDLIPEGEIKKVTFGIAYRQDLFRFNGFESGVDFTAREVRDPSVVDLTETRWFEVEGDVMAQDILGTLDFTLLVARDLESPFQIIEPKLFAADGIEACYVTVDQIPASFIPREFCGTQVLRNFLNDLPPTSVISMSPNPAKDVITLTYDVNIAETAMSIEVYDLLGNRVMSVMDGKTHAKGRYTETIDASKLTSGNYTVRLVGRDRVTSRQVLVKH
ncbi:MAG TPA: T9SS type A sorting domain-containing protein, partial [Candidatus Kapabacteria bacterium]|nr:T9SS type A sorting domain-containing protein [Candidatus Kapabacteria bacterium]